MNKPKYDLEERLLEYSVRIIKFVEQLPTTRVGNHVAGQFEHSIFDISAVVFHSMFDILLLINISNKDGRKLKPS